MTVFVTNLSFSAVHADTLPLQLAATEAALLCSAIGADSIDHCGTQITGRSVTLSIARGSVKRFYQELAAFLALCGQVNGRDCMAEAEWITTAGIKAALDQAVDR